MLILFKQTPNGIFAYPPDIPENEVCTAVYFDTVTKTIFTSGTVGGGSFEMATDQLIWTDPATGDQYLYDGAEDFYIMAGTGPEPAKTYTLELKTNPRGSTLPILDITPAGPYTANTVVSISILPGGPGWEFMNWTLNGEEVSLTPDFDFTTLAVDTIMVANFQYEEEPTSPGSDPSLPLNFVPKNFYPLEIRVAGAQIPIKTITSNINTGIFSDDLEGDYHYPISLPVTDQVLVALKLPNDPQSIWTFSEPIPAELWGHGNRKYRGHLDILNGGDGKSIRATFVFDSGFFIQQNKTRSIRDCYDDTDIITLDEPVYAVGGYELRFNLDNLTLKVNSYTKLFIKDAFENHILMLEAMYDYLKSLPLNLDIRIEYSEDLTDESSKIIYWDTNIVTTTELKRSTGSRYTRAKRLTSKRFLMDAWNEVDETRRIAFPSIYNRELYEGNNQLHDGIVNRYDTLGRLYFGNINYQTFSESFKWQHALIPFIYLSDIVRTIFKKLNIEVSGSFFEDDRVKRMLIYNNRTLDFIQLFNRATNGLSRRTALAIHNGDLDPNQETYVYENVHDFNIKLKNHVPDYPIITFLKAMKNYFGLKYDFNLLQNRVEIRFIRDVIRSMETLDLTKNAGRVYVLTHGKEQGINFVYEYKDPLLEDGQSESDPDPDYNVTNYLALEGLDAEIGETAFVRSLRAFFTLTTDQDNPPFWKLTAFMQRDEKAEFKRTWTIGMVPLIDGFFDGRKMPAIEMTANNPEVNLANEAIGIRIFAYYGRQLDGNGNPYSFASCTRYNAQELASNQQYDLDIRSEDSYPFFKDLEAILDRSKLYETVLILNDAYLFRLSKTRRIRIANIEYLIDTMEITQSEREYYMAKAKMYKINLTRPANRPDVFTPANDGFDYDLDFDLD